MVSEHPISIITEKIEEEWTKATGMRSGVFKNREEREGAVKIGHVVLMDIEDYEPNEIMLSSVLDEYLPVYSVFKSSENNYHVISPVLMSMAEVIHIKKSIELDDDAHIDVGIKKEGWTLRISEKGHKSAPEHIITSTNLNKKLKENYIFSSPHSHYLKDRTESNIYHTIIHECSCMGDNMEIRRYKTRANNHEIIQDKRETFKAFRVILAECTDCVVNANNICDSHSQLISLSNSNKPYDVSIESIMNGA